MEKYLDIIQRFLMKPSTRHAVEIFGYYCMPLFLFVYAYFQSLQGEAQLAHSMKELGEKAIFLIFFLLYLKPLAVICSRIPLFQIMLGYRRILGVMTFWIASFHSLYYIVEYDLLTSAQSDTLFDITNVLFWGMLTYIGISIAGLTSNTLATQVLKKHWFTLQKIVYWVALTAVIHVSLIKSSNTWLIVLIVLILLKIWQYRLKFHTFL